MKKIVRMFRLSGPATATAVAVLIVVGCVSRQTTAGPPATDQTAAVPGGAEWIGKKAAGFVLPDSGGKTVDVGKVIGVRPVVLVFYRGVW